VMSVSDIGTTRGGVTCFQNTGRERQEGEEGQPSGFDQLRQEIAQGRGVEEQSSNTSPAEPRARLFEHLQETCCSPCSASLLKRERADKAIMKKMKLKTAPHE
jgi:hypothetical protein